jgi:hypothetical protein
MSREVSLWRELPARGYHAALGASADGNVFRTSGGDCTASGTFTHASACTGGVD